MLSLLKKRKVQTEKPRTRTSKYLVSRDANELLSKNNRRAIIVKIKRSFSVTDDVWNEHYLYAIHQFLELAQELPASEIHHHSKEGGLIDHTLEAVYAGVRIAQGYILPPNAEPEKILAHNDRWRFGVFIAILAHDLGKIVTDIEIVFREGEGGFQKWHPWIGKLPKGQEYVFRYRKRLENAKLSKGMHEKAAISLLPQLLTHKATFWLVEDQELFSQILSTISQSTFGGGTIAEIVRKADSSSVSSNLGADTGVNSVYSDAIPLHEKLIVSLRKLISDGDLKRNRPGAALWITEKYTWVVSKAVMEAVQAQLKNEGHKGIPSNVVRLFEVLREHDMILPNHEGNSVWSGKIKDFNNNWKMTLTFLKFENSLLWPTSDPEKFNGEITPLDREGNEVIEESDQAEIASPVIRNQFDPLVLTPNKVKADKKIEVTELDEHADHQPKDSHSEEREPETSDDQLTQPLIIEADQVTEVKGEDARTVIQSHPFFKWLIRAVKHRKIRVNEAKAPVHVLDDYVALVTPEIFNKYFKSENTMKQRMYEARAGNKPPYTAIQKEIEKFGINKKSLQGTNIHNMVVEGPNNQANLKVYLFERSYLPELDNFAPNKAMKVEI